MTETEQMKSIILVYCDILEIAVDGLESINSRQAQRVLKKMSVKMKKVKELLTCSESLT